MKKLKALFIGAAAVLLAPFAQAQATTYDIDVPGMHASINFKVNHLGFSWLVGRFDKFEGYYVHDPKNPANEKVQVTIDTRSINSNHAERDRHLRSDDFLNVRRYPEAKFVSTSVVNQADGSKLIKGNFTLNGVTQPLEIVATKIGEGTDPWGGYRSGFEGSTEFKMKDFNFKRDLGPGSATVYLNLHIEGIKR
ncbi:YceI family protein [Thiomicrospira microaerophila]|uniref:YceI family protein n=1 Tax=Thiomicrospira microaerophila TaxID=406020 RepID=UPI0005CA85F4|nr:YceI family protein [Thiomicrospira microaerophila]